jgi:tetratricopeptide (TPR) repeat protein
MKTINACRSGGFGTPDWAQAMVKAPTHMAAAPPRGSAPPERARQQLWQLPVFLLGVLTVVGVWYARPRWYDPAARQFRDDLAATRKALDPASLDTALALAKGEELLDQAARFPNRAGEIHYLVGSAYLFRAGEVSVEQKTAMNQQARHHLEEAEQLGVPAGDRTRLQYRLARAWYLTGVEAPRVLSLLTQTLEAADDLTQAYEMLTQVNLRLPEPDLVAALEANGKQLALPTDNEDLLAPARLQRGELLLRLQKSDEARKVLGRIRPSARPPEVYARARLLRAQSCQQDGLWQEAAALWEEILRDATEPPADSSRMLYFLGLCYRRLDRRPNAIRVWDRLLTDESESGQAAALGLAELRLAGPDPASAMECYERALRNVKTPADYRNRLVSLDEARRVVERGCESFLRTGDFERAQQLCQLINQLAPGTNRQLRAELEEAWAKDCQRRTAKGGNCAARWLERAAAHFQEAGAAYDAIAESASSQADKAKWLWLSATCYLQGQHHASAAALLRRYISLESQTDKLGLAWFTLAEVHRALHDEPSARAAYLKCIEYPSPLAYRARYQMALVDINQARAAKDAKKLEDAEKALEQNLELMRFAPDEEAYQKTLMALADLAMQRGNFRLASIRLQEMLDRYPGNPQQIQIRLDLADCFRRLATLEDQNLRRGGYVTEEAQLHYREQRRQWLQKAVGHYQKLADDLTARGPAGRLPAGEEAILQKAQLSAAECHFEQGQYLEAAFFFDKVVARYPHQGVALKALREMTRCYLLVRDDAKRKDTLQRLHGVLRELPDQVFSEEPDMPSRQEWEQWLEWAAKQ